VNRCGNRLMGTLVALACMGILGCGTATTSPSEVVYVVGGPTASFISIAAALQAAPPGEVVEVHGGPHAERVVIDKPGIKLRGVGAVLDGSSVDAGRGIGIHVNGVADVEISGFVVRNFERGIVVQNALGAVIRQNEVHSNNSKTANSAPPLAPGVDLFEGVVLLGAGGSQVFENILRNNGHDGLMIADGSRNNVIRNNRILNNGAQTVPGQFG